MPRNEAHSLTLYLLQNSLNYHQFAEWASWFREFCRRYKVNKKNLLTLQSIETANKQYKRHKYKPPTCSLMPYLSTLLI